MVHSAKPDKIVELHDYNILIETREIFLYEHSEELVTHDAINFLKNLRLLLSVNSNPIIIHQHSFGGEWSAGMNIYDNIASCHEICPIIFICHGCAGSMGSIIPQSVYGNGVRLCQPNCEFLIHEGQLSLTGSHKSVQSLARSSNNQIEFMYNIYAEACCSGYKFEGKTFEQVKNYIKSKLRSKDDWVLSAEEAVEYGFVDGVLGSEEFPSINTVKKNIKDYVS